MPWYLDSSALVKLMATEAETAALRAFLRGHVIASSELAVTELGRSALRRSPVHLRAANALLLNTDLLPLDGRVLRPAATLLPLELRSLDAIHVASALQMGAACDGIITYDRRMQEAARLAGLRVEAPGALDSDADH